MSMERMLDIFMSLWFGSIGLFFLCIGIVTPLFIIGNIAVILSSLFILFMAYLFGQNAIIGYRQIAPEVKNG